MTAEEAKLNLETGRTVVAGDAPGRGRPRKAPQALHASGASGTTSRRQIELPLMALSLALPLLIWTLVYLSGKVNDIFLPSPWQSARAGYDMFASGNLLNDTRASSQRVALGFGIRLLFAVPAGSGDGHLP